MPMQVESDEIKLENANLWLIDERLAFHNYLASDKSSKGHANNRVLQRNSKAGYCIAQCV